MQRELRIAGIAYEVADDWVFVREAHVLRKRMPLFYWSEEYVRAFQACYAPTRPPPAPGSLLYLGRYDIASEAVARRYPSEDTARAVVSMGGTVARQQALNVETASQLAEQAETVVADHGSGVLNIMFWRPRAVIELVVDDWWVNNNLFVAHDMGVEHYAVIKVDGLTSLEITRKLDACLAHFRSRPAALDAGERRSDPISQGREAR